MKCKLYGYEIDDMIDALNSIDISFELTSLLSKLKANGDTVFTVTIEEVE